MISAMFVCMPTAHQHQVCNRVFYVIKELKRIEFNFPKQTAKDHWVIISALL